jgi:hypothetical protein
MPIRFACPSCSKVYKAPDEHKGKTTTCKNCGAAVVIPEPVREVLFGVPLPPDGAVEPSPDPAPRPADPPAPTPAAVSNGRPDPVPSTQTKTRRTTAPTTRPDELGSLRAARSRRAQNRLLVKVLVLTALVTICIILAQRVIQKSHDIENTEESQGGSVGTSTEPMMTIIFDRGMDLSRDERGRLVELGRSGPGPVDFKPKQVISEDPNVKLVGELIAEYRQNKLVARKKYQDTRVRTIGAPVELVPNLVGRGATIKTVWGTWEFDDTSDIEKLNFTPKDLYLAVVEGTLVTPSRYTGCKLRGYGARLDGNGLKQSLRVR